MGMNGNGPVFYRWKAAGAAALAGAAILGYGLLSPAGRAAVPGWEPVNDRVIAALDAAASPAAASGSPAAPAAQPAEAAQAAPLLAQASAAGAAGGASLPPGASASVAAAEPSAAAPDDAGLLNLNTATAAELDALKGIGPAKAQAIVAYREQHGAFHSVDDLLDIKGIGEKLLAGIRADVTV